MNTTEHQPTLARAATRNRGNGRIFEREGSSFLWIAYYRHGKQIRESTETTDREKAAKFLKKRLIEVGAERLGKADFIGPQQERLKVGKLLDALVDDYKLRGKNSPQFRSHLKRIRSCFGTWRALEVTPDAVDEFIAKMKEAGAADATINRSTQLLSQAFKLAEERGQLSKAPLVRHLTENNVRVGFFEATDFDRIMEHLPSHLQDYVQFGFSTGWRKGEIASLRWTDVEGDVIRLRAENSKNRNPRSLPLVGDLAEVIERRKATRQVKTESGVMLAAYVFHVDGQPIGDFRKSWWTACVKAGLGTFKCSNPKCECRDLPTSEHKCPQCKKETRYSGRLFHDFRRTAARNMRKAGVPEGVCMSITGHKTRSMFDRYDIKDESDQRDALHRTQAYLEHGIKQPRTPALIVRAGATEK